MVTMAQIEANKRNALLAKGPKSPSGRENSRKNALKHGLAGEGVVLSEAMEAEVARVEAALARRLGIQGDDDRALVRLAAVETVRLDRAAREEWAILDDLRDRAEDSWDEDRALRAEEMAARLPKDPVRVVAGLRQSYQGADWLIRRWRGLRAAVEAEGWDDARKDLALDLMATPPECRGIAAFGAGPVADDFARIDAEIAELIAYRDRALAPRDDRDREDALAGQGPGDSPRLARLHRYISASFRRLTFAYQALGLGHRPRASTPVGPPSVVAGPDPEPAPAPPLPEPAAKGLPPDSPRFVLIDALKAEANALGAAYGVSADGTNPIPAPIDPAAPPRKRPPAPADRRDRRRKRHRR